MTDEMNQGPKAAPAPEPAPEPAERADVPPADVPPVAPGGEEARTTQAREWLAQLQQMIDRVAAEAAPVARDVAAKAAELAAVAGEKAGTLAKRAAEATGDVGIRVAERSRRFADDMRHRAAEGGVEPPVAPEDAPSPGAAPATEVSATPEEAPPA